MTIGTRTGAISGKPGIKYPNGKKGRDGSRSLGMNRRGWDFGVTSLSNPSSPKFYIFPTSFTPVTQCQRGKVLEKKIERLNASAFRFLKGSSRSSRNNSPLEPEAYSEEGAKCDEFTEKEFNALIAKNTDLANKLAVDFSGDLARPQASRPSHRLSRGWGKTLKVSAGVELAYTDGKRR